MSTYTDRHRDPSNPDDYPQCTHYSGGWTPEGKRLPGQRCTKPAHYLLIQPDGRPNPDGYVCAEHGLIVCTEYREKLDEEWKMRKVKPV